MISGWRLGPAAPSLSCSAARDCAASGEPGPGRPAFSGAWPSAGQGSSAVRGRSVSADLLGQGDDDARGAAQVAQQEDVLVLGHLAEELSAVGAQPGDGVMDVI